MWWMLCAARFFEVSISYTFGTVGRHQVNAAIDSRINEKVTDNSTVLSAPLYRL
jgi:hypothetical protein